MKNIPRESAQGVTRPQALEAGINIEDSFALTVRDGSLERSDTAIRTGIGTTYSAVHNTPFPALMVRVVPFEVDVDGIEEREVPLRTTLHDDGILLGGIDESGNLHTSLALWEEQGSVQDPLERFEVGLAKQRTLQAAGVEPIFAPVDARGVGEGVCIAPKYNIVAKGRQFAISGIYTNASLRPSLLVYPEESEQPVHYYQSKSHGVWRALLAQGESQDMRNGWFAKGMFGYESTTDAPLTMQKLFAILQAVKQPDQRGRQEMTQFVPQIPENQALPADMQEFSALAPAADAMLEAGISSIAGYRIAPHLRPAKERARTSGQRLFRRAARPDFSVVLDSWKVATAYYGDVTVRVVPSKDGVVQYGIYEACTEEGRKQRWVGTAEIADAPLTWLGLAKEWPALPRDIIEPPIEYAYAKDGKNTGYNKRRDKVGDLERYIVRSLAAHRGRHPSHGCLW